MSNGKKISEDLVRHIGFLGRLKLSDHEVNLFSEQLSSIVAYFEQLNELDTSGVAPTAHALPIHNVFRPDEPGLTTQPLGPDVALANAPERDGNFFRVPKVLEQDSA
jgi:aspartyl-tRNA(Asn)/glutamyl-tRNA(Gln) amidotransferase subunit C